MADRWTLRTPTGDLQLNETFAAPTYQPGGVDTNAQFRREGRTAFQRAGDGLRTPGPLRLTGRVWRDDRDAHSMRAELHAIREAVMACTSVQRLTIGGQYTYTDLAGGPPPAITPDGRGGWVVEIELWPGRAEPKYLPTPPGTHYIDFTTDPGVDGVPTGFVLSREITNFEWRLDEGLIGRRVGIQGVATGPASSLSWVAAGSPEELRLRFRFVPVIPDQVSAALYAHLRDPQGPQNYGMVAYLYAWGGLRLASRQSTAPLDTRAEVNLGELADVDHHMRFQALEYKPGSLLARVKVWPDTEPEPVAWSLEWDGFPPNSGGVASISSGQGRANSDMLTIYEAYAVTPLEAG